MSPHRQRSNDRLMHDKNRTGRLFEKRACDTAKQSFAYRSPPEAADDEHASPELLRNVQQMLRCRSGMVLRNVRPDPHGMPGKLTFNLLQKGQCLLG